MITNPRNIEELQDYVKDAFVDIKRKLETFFTDVEARAKEYQARLEFLKPKDICEECGNWNEHDLYCKNYITENKNEI
ncbi:MAG: hypothetical protein AABY15_02320 [Nanoarchaeota archaeon]